jgi:2-phosphosulfolactate phosphatase
VKIRTFFSAAEAEGAEMPGSLAVVVDVVRATSTMVEALANGARAIYPTVSTEEAIHLANSLGREDTLLCGERRGLKVDGFDLGNSPREYGREQVGGKRLVMSTTNGTRAFVATQGAERVLAGSLLNLGALVEDVRKSAPKDLVVVCAGKEGLFSLDDAACAGLILQDLVEGDWNTSSLEMNDASRAALSLAKAYRVDEAFLRRTAAGAALVRVELGEDLALCAERDRHALVPEMRDRMIHLPGVGS